MRDWQRQKRRAFLAGAVANAEAWKLRNCRELCHWHIVGAQQVWLYILNLNVAWNPSGGWMGRYQGTWAPNQSRLGCSLAILYWEQGATEGVG